MCALQPQRACALLVTLVQTCAEYRALIGSKMPFPCMAGHTLAELTAVIELNLIANHLRSSSFII
jgi:hypothetical protein